MVTGEGELYFGNHFKYSRHHNLPRLPVHNPKSQISNPKSQIANLNTPDPI